MKHCKRNEKGQFVSAKSNDNTPPSSECGACKFYLQEPCDGCPIHDDVQDDKCSECFIKDECDDEIAADCTEPVIFPAFEYQDKLFKDAKDCLDYLDAVWEGKVIESGELEEQFNLLMTLDGQEDYNARSLQERIFKELMKVRRECDEAKYARGSFARTHFKN